ncbi:MAG: hypothetical protein LBR53_08125, partial [Deltaproteobacteria bacterium]|nr:hypothetical protein [Deltaproteobacteria bacterium]
METVKKLIGLEDFAIKNPVIPDYTDKSGGVSADRLAATLTGLFLVETRISEKNQAILSRFYLNHASLVSQLSEKGARAGAELTKIAVSLWIINFPVTSMDIDRGYVSIISSKTFASQGLVIILDLAKVPKEDDGTTLWKY